MRFQKSWMTATLALAALSSAGAAVAQEKAPKPDSDVVIERRVEVEASRDLMGQAEIMASGGPNTFVFVNSEMSFDRKIVKGAPYSAEATTETVQTLSDGNRIVRKNSATVYRDGEGRTRREQTLGAIGQWSAAGEPPKTIFINDPVARVNYVLDPKSQTARKMGIPQLPPGQTFMKMPEPPQGAPLPPPPPSGSAPPAGGVRVFDDGNGERGEMHKPKVESLGRQTIEGVEAEGTRTTMTIPAGKIGNERAIDIVTERWYSPELQVVVMSKRSDPMAGETTYRLTNINRAEPSRSLFEVPPGYTVKEGREFNFQYRAPKPNDK